VSRNIVDILSIGFDEFSLVLVHLTLLGREFHIIPYMGTQEVCLE